MEHAAPRSVLVVEDESIIAHDIQQTLAGLGYDAFGVASSAEEAITMASERCPDVALMDIRIKGKLDGISTARLLQERFGVPIVYLTAHADQATLERARETQPLGYLIKPVNKAELYGAIEVALYRHQMERRLRQRERWFSTTLRSISDAVIAVDLRGHITFMNATAELLTGWQAEQALGRSAHEVVRLLTEGVSVLGETPLERALREGLAIELSEASLQSTDGTIRAITDSAAPVTDSAERLGAVMVFRDITEQKKLQSQVELSHRLASLGTMAAGVAHEVNNPLNAIVGGAELIAIELNRQQHDIAAGRSIPEEERARRLEKALRMLSLLQSGASRIATIVSQLQAFSRPTPQAPGRAEVSQCVEWAFWVTSQQFHNRARMVKKLVQVPAVRADETRLGEVLVNLLVNAAQAIAPGNVDQNQVTVATRTDQRGWVVIEVRDTGPGIAPDVLHRIFEPFYTTKAVGEGTGLGLSICHGIVTSLGGELRVESQIGGGSTFIIALPPAPPEPAAEPPAAREAVAGVKARVLVIDDEEMLLEIIAESLAKHEVRCLSSPKEASKLLREGADFDVIFCDLMMPDMTGMALYEELLGSRPAMARRMVFMTGGVTTTRSADFLHSIPNRSINKPFMADVLDEIIQEVISKA